MRVVTIESLVPCIWSPGYLNKNALFHPIYRQPESKGKDRYYIQLLFEGIGDRGWNYEPINYFRDGREDIFFP